MGTRHCTKCGREVKGHIGQCGEKCTMPEFEENMSESEDSGDRLNLDQEKSGATGGTPE